MQNARVSWYRRSALMYTLGAWTVMGFLGFQSYRLLGKKEAEDEKEQGNAAEQIPGGVSKTISEDRLSETITYRVPGKSFYVTSTVSYKPNFVPYSTRLSNYVESTRLYKYMQSFFEDSAGKEK